MDEIDGADTESILPSSISGFTSKDFSPVLEDELLVCPKCLLGVGAYGAVYEATLKVKGSSSPRVVAVKFQALPEEDMLLNNLVAELSLLQGLQHDNLLHFSGAALLMPPPPQPGMFLPFEPSSLCVAMVTEVARNGDVETWIAKAARLQEKGIDVLSTLPWALRVRCCAQVASALDFIHCQDVVHRDLKTANILFDGKFNAKVCDFGLAIGAESPMKMLFVGGTESYMAPEVLLAEDYGPPSDVYSLGLVIASLLSLKPIGEEYRGDIPLDRTCFEEEGEDSEEVVAYEESHVHEDSPLSPIEPILVRHPRTFFEASSEEIRQHADPTAPPSLIELAIQCCSNDPDSRPDAGDVVIWLNDILTTLSADQPITVPSPNPPSLLELALPKVRKQLSLWKGKMQQPTRPRRPEKPPPQTPSKPGRPVPLPPKPSTNNGSGSSFSLPPRPKTPPPLSGPKNLIPLKALSLTDRAADGGTSTKKTRATIATSSPHVVDELSVLLSSLALKVKDKGALERASKTNPASLVGRWVFIQGLGIGQVAEFHRVKSITQRRTHDSYHTVELSSNSPTMAAPDLMTRTGSVLIPSGMRLATASSPDVLSHESVHFDSQRPSMAHMPLSPSSRVPHTKRVRCLLRRRKLGKINTGLKFVLVESPLLPDSSAHLTSSPHGTRELRKGASQSGADESGDESGGEDDNNPKDDSEVKKHGWLSLERPGGGMVPRYFTLTEVGLGYSKAEDKQPKNDATHCVLLPHLIITLDMNNPRRFRVGRWFMEGLDEEDIADWVKVLEVAIKKASNHNV
mmetsp:Transcript_32039/g.41187  ORF Transcript_32039/g.41187 Transcript_32039/m.41187 type:complete len:798 (+) Transcript_32039:99-2492(+)